MKPSYKIIFFLLLAFALIIIFYPTGKKPPNLDGYWSVDEMVIDGKVSPVKADARIYSNHIDIKDGSIDYFIYGMTTFKITDNDSIHLAFKKDLPFNGVYKINLSTKIIGGGKSASYRSKLKLVSKNKSIIMYREEPVEWMEGIPHGSP